MSDFIKTYRNGVEKVWSRKQWDTLGSDKYGWEPIPDIPKEVAEKITPGQPEGVASDEYPIRSEIVTKLSARRERKAK